MRIANLLCAALALATVPLAAQAQTFTTLSSFGGARGGNPNGLTAYGNAFFGTASRAGAFNEGTVYRLRPATGAVKSIYTFQGEADGAVPEGDVLPLNSLLYGVTAFGGVTCSINVGCGTVFSVDPASGTHRVVYSFKGGADGEVPLAGLTLLNGLLYGTTNNGGTGGCTDGCGTIFSIDPASGNHTVLYNFQGTDGAGPLTALTAQGGNLFGTTRVGGQYNLGTVFWFSTSTGEGGVLHSFDGGADGGLPSSPLTVSNGLLYGGTESGGEHYCQKYGGCGLIYAIDPASGTETVLFENPVRASPGPLVVHGPNLYGTTQYARGGGSIFEIRLSDSHYRKLYAFTGGTDGVVPSGALVFRQGAFFGTTTNGGHVDLGTAFKFAP